MRVRSEADIKLFVNKEDIIVIKSDKSKRYGYARLSNTLGRCFDFSLALILIILASPFFLVIAIIIKLNDGGSVFFKQSRMGHHKKLFTIYKFRTLIPDADKIVGAEVLDIKHNVSTPLGNFLRNTRLDELPQLINILKGDMAFIGPRPQRPEIVAHFGTHIRDYDKRFTVKPGLIGFPQLFLPHNAPKKIQSSIDNMYLKIQQDYFWEIFLLFFTIYNVFKKFIVISANWIWNSIKKLWVNFDEKRILERKTPKKGAYFSFQKENGWGSQRDKNDLKILDVNEEALLFRSDKKINLDGTFKAKISINFKAYGKLKRKTLYCEGTLYKERKEKDGYSYIIFYTPLTPLNFYLANQYLLGKSMAYG